MFMSTVSAGGGSGVSGSAAARVVPNNKRQRRVPLAFSLFTFLILCQFIFLHSSSVSGAEAKVKLKPKGEEGKQTKPGNVTQTPTKNEEVRTRKKDSPKKTGDDDEENGSEGGNFWVGSHKLDFKPHPLLSPQISHSQSFHSEIPIIELGAESSLPSTDDDDVSESESSEEIRKKNKRKSRDRRKKARDQRKITHRTLWSRNATRDNPFLNMNMNSPIIYGQHPIQQQGIMTGGSAPYLNRNDDSYHGSSATWNLNHPGNGIQDNSGSPMQHYPQTNSIQQFQLAYQQQLQKMAHHHKFPQMMSLPGGGPQFSPSAPDTTADMMMNMNSFPPQSPPQQMIQQPLQSYGSFQSSMSSAPPGMGGSLSGSNGGPFLVYVTPGGMAQTSSGPIPMKAYPPGDMQLMPYNHNHITEPVMEGLTHNPRAAPPSGHNHNSQSGGTSNPQFLRNNFLRMFMDRLVSVGKVLPIPFVTKYSHSHSKPPPGHFNNRRM